MLIVDNGDAGDYGVDDKWVEFYHMSVFCHMAAISDAIDKLNAPVKILSSERDLRSEMMISVSKLVERASGWLQEFNMEQCADQVKNLDQF